MLSNKGKGKCVRMCFQGSIMKYIKPIVTIVSRFIS